MFLSDKEIRGLIGNGLGIEPYNEAQLTPNGYDLSIEVLDKNGNPIESTSYNIKPDELVKVKSVETLNIPNGYMGLMLLRSRYTRQGLIGMFGVVDSGFNGKILASIKNLGSEDVGMKLKEGVIHLILARMSSGSEVPYGTDAQKHHWQNQK
ncbi:MAG: hypothetical protein KGH59_04910 [Candidatus Micrarchaeota archaeon]|nr:hypothetical protein [Candidatus Micrarchaeota archaeon]MDE1805089.1 hypothetical protein [Candidatus Micrarchaeota archaeon]MDE1847043.1 hypothetical protein [Candidatus Micrarchaeota archaeon]